MPVNARRCDETVRCVRGHGARPVRDGRRDVRVFEFGEADAVRADFMKRRLNAFIGVLNLAGVLKPSP